MRITTRISTTRYLTSLQNTAAEVARLQEQTITGRKYMKVSEDVAAAVKGYQIRSEIKSLDSYRSIIQSCDGKLSSAEGSLMHIQDVLTKSRPKILQAINGTQGNADRETIATELTALQEEILQTLNSNAAGSYYFGGSSTLEPPFTTNANGYLCYQGQELNSMSPVDFDKFHHDVLFADIGLGIQLDASGNVDMNSVFTFSIAGPDITGYGVRDISDDPLNPDIVPQNLYDLIGELVKEMRKPNAPAEPPSVPPAPPDPACYSYERANKLLGLFQEKEQSVMNSVTEVGARRSYLQFLDARYATREVDALDAQVATEGADPYRTVIYFESMKVAYQAALKMGTEVIPMSIFNFIS